ncbi:hypothetical protein IW261DRAFT_1497251 [Armillaria novae-zelandiae]|uniref:DUF6697 domain-containing protein n=1 Tax=Armillaria novae-zelandiae TaxID=153914 RepID=A0AA39NZN3_9AGAR|nr:hypothetical protein IW261DRAFT_1497251 [Armillaria novae-zelandiae]
MSGRPVRRRVSESPSWPLPPLRLNDLTEAENVRVLRQSLRSLNSALSLLMAAVPPFLHGPGMTPEVFKCLEVWWASKYKDGYNSSFNDFEQLKIAYGFQMNDLMSCRAKNARFSSAIDTLQVESELLKRQNESLKEDVEQAKQTEEEARDEVLALRKDKQDLVERLAAEETKTTDLFKQMDAFRVQAKTLAAQAHQRRLEIVSMSFGKTSFVEATFVPTRVLFNDPAQIMSALPSELTQCLRVYFLPLPPRSMPLHIPKIARAGYWFHPPITIPEGTPVELVVEAKPHEWLYLGRYLSALLDGENMKLSEWIALDAQTKTAYCTSVSRTLKEQMPNQQVSCADIQRQLDSGEHSAPCYSLQCIGYDFALQEAFVKASTSQSSDIDT